MSSARRVDEARPSIRPQPDSAASPLPASSPCEGPGGRCALRARGETDRGEAGLEPAPIKPIIGIDVVDALDVRVGTIRRVSDVEDADRLVQLRVDFGDHERTIVAALKGERDDPTEIEGRQALFIVNLEPRSMRGVVSEGMLFDIGYADGIDPCLAVPERPVPEGARAG